MKGRPAPTSVDDYIAAHLNPVAQLALERVRRAIRKSIPKAEETISYDMPAYKLQGRVVLYFAGWKKHYALYAASAPLIAAFQHELAPYEVKNATIRFPLTEPVPVRLIEAIARFRALEVTAAAKKST